MSAPTGWTRVTGPLASAAMWTAAPVAASAATTHHVPLVSTLPARVAAMWCDSVEQGCHGREAS